jgi:pimeloyl-ACP methyl ester carboxylesterase
LSANQQEALIQGGKGVAMDAAIHYRYWGFRLAEISGRVHIVHSTEDNFGPRAYAHHLTGNIPQARLHLLENQGHLFPWTHQDFIFQLSQS